MLYRSTDVIIQLCVTCICLRPIYNVNVLLSKTLLIGHFCVGFDCKIFDMIGIK